MKTHLIKHIQNTIQFLLKKQSQNNTFDRFIDFCKTYYDKPVHTLSGMKLRQNTKLKGDIVECLRIRPIVTIPAKPKLPDERFKSAMIALKEGTVTVLKLRTSYDLTQDQLDQIKEVEDAKNTM